LAAVGEQRRQTTGPGRLAGAARREVYAALDLGTNNCRLLVARPAIGGFRVIDAYSRIVCLGEGLSASGRLSEPAMERSLAALADCAGKIRRRRVTRLRAVATEACRRAANRGEFLARVRGDTGIELEIISGSEEANLALAGCAPLLDPYRRHALIFDIGGGSTQVSWLELPRLGRTLQASAPSLRGWHSVPIGVVTLSEAYGGHEASEGAYETMVAEMSAALAPFEARHGLAALAARRDAQMIGTSGTVTTLTGIHKRLPRYNRARVDGAYLDFPTIGALSRRITAMSHEERVRQPCIGRQRAGLVVAGCAILEAICRTWPVGRLRVADRGLREGILFNLIGPSVAEKSRRTPNPRPVAKPCLAATPCAIAGPCSPCMAGGCGAAG
jgi:exopolyphosphatase/guanosine-5'-triphosphate,3'-diphosphate pyrophosphatase